jgi:hypothetical protein
VEQGRKAERVEQGGKAQNGMREEGTERGAERGGKVRNEGGRCGTRGEGAERGGKTMIVNKSEHVKQRNDQQRAKTV